MKEIKLCIIGKWIYHATDFVKKNNNVPGCSVVAAWDSDPEGGRSWAESLGMEFYESLDELLSRPDIDGVIIATDTASHEEMSIKVAKAGKSMIVEKAPMVSLEAAERVVKAVRDNNVVYVFSDPVRKGYMLKLKEMMDEGAFGDITMLHVRSARDTALRDAIPVQFYNKSEAVAGTTVDIGYHALHALQWFLGRPTSCAAVKGYVTEKSGESGIEDNSVVSFSFENGALGIAESCWAGDINQECVDIYGTKGCAHCFDRGDIVYCLEDRVWRTIKSSDLPPEGPKPMTLWLDYLMYGREPKIYREDEALEVTYLLEAALNSL